MKIAFIGTGKMAEAIISAIVSKRVFKPFSIIASDINKNRLEYISQKYKVKKADSNIDAVAKAHIVVLSVKPQDFPSLLPEIAPWTKNKLVISIAAGKTIKNIKSYLKNAFIVRVMPNLPCVIHRAMSVYTALSSIKKEHLKIVEKIFGSCGVVIKLPERYFDVVTALSGSGPAFLACIIDKFISAATKLGLKRRDASLLIKQTMLGTAEYLIKMNIEPSILIQAVTSKKGTTAAGMTALDSPVLEKIIFTTLKRAATRSKELSKI